MFKKYIIIHPNFRLGGAEQSAIGKKADMIVTYGDLVDKERCKSLNKIVLKKNKFITFFYLLDLILKSKSLIKIETNQISAFYFWILNIFKNVNFQHTQRSSLRGEYLMSNNFLKRPFIFLVFQIAPLLVKTFVPSKSLKNDFIFSKKIKFIPNKIIPVDAEINSKKPSRDIVIVSRVSPEKKLYETLELLNFLEISPRLSITVIGSKINKKYKNLNLKCIEKTYNRKDYFSQISSHKCGLLFSGAEGFGNVVPEYLFCGVHPIVNMCQWGPSETIIRFGFGTICQFDWSKNHEIDFLNLKENIICALNNYCVPIEIRKKVKKFHS